MKAREQRAAKALEDLVAEEERSKRVAKEKEEKKRDKK